MVSIFVFMHMKSWQVLGRKSGISTVQGTENTGTVHVQIESQELGFGRPLELTGLYIPLKESALVWRSLLCSTEEELLKEWKLTGWCMSLGFHASQTHPLPKNSQTEASLQMYVLHQVLVHVFIWSIGIKLRYQSVYNNPSTLLNQLS